MENTKVIEPVSLSYRPLTEEETRAVSEYVQEIHHNLLFKFFGTTALLVVSSFFTYDTLQSTGSLISPLPLFLIFLCISLIIFGIIQLIKLRKISVFSYTRAEYGIVKEKENHTFTIYFPYQNGILRKVLCDHFLWEAVQIEDMVFVISFNDKECIAVKKKKNTP